MNQGLSGAKAVARQPSYRANLFPAGKSHKNTVQSLLPVPMAAILPSAEKAMPLKTLKSRLNDRSSFWEARSQRRSALSQPADQTLLPSAEKTQAYRALPPCPATCKRCLPLPVSQQRRVPSSLLVATVFPSGDKDREVRGPL